MKVSIFFAAFLFLAVICASFTYAGGKGKGKGGDGGKGKGGGGDGGGKGKGKGHLIHDTLDVDQRKFFYQFLLTRLTMNIFKFLVFGNQMWDDQSSLFGGKGKKGK